MATVVFYDHEFVYRYNQQGKVSPIIQVQIRNPLDPAMVVEVDAHLDSGAERSLFDGVVVRAVGLDLMAGSPMKYQATSGAGMDARLHGVILSHPDLGPFRLAVGFSEEPIRRNLLGRDFFSLMQIGFRERHSVFYLTATP